MHYRINKMFFINKYARKTKHYTTFAEYIKYTMIDADCSFHHLCEYHTGVTVLTTGTSMYALNLSALCYLGLICHHKLQSLRALYDKIIYDVNTTKTYSLMPLNFTKSRTHSLNKLNKIIIHH